MAEKAPNLVKLVLKRAFWPDEDKRVNEGEVIEVTAEQALTLIENGIASRDAALTQEGGK